MRDDILMRITKFPNEFINARMHFQDLADHFINNVKYVNNEITFDELKHRVWEEGQENE